jgi:hypothetical protein
MKFPDLAYIRFRCRPAKLGRGLASISRALDDLD